MKVKRCELAEAPIELIDRLGGNYFFSSTSFAKLWTSMGGIPVFWNAEEDGRVFAVLPGVEFGKGIFRRFQSMPNGCYGRLFHLEMERERLATISGQIAVSLIQEGYAQVYINDFGISFASLGDYRTAQYFTHLVDISSPDWEPPDSKLRQQIHKAQRDGLRIESFNASRNMNNFMKLVKLHERRRNTTSPYTQEFFEVLAELSGKDDRIKWVWCEHDKKPVESSIFFRDGDSIIHWQMYYDEALSHLQSTKLIPYQVSKEAQKRGILKLNLGSSPPEAEGAEFYKRKWGGEKYAYSCYVHKSFLGKLW